MPSKLISEDYPELRRDLGLGAAVLLGLGSILGTGVFVSIGVAAGIAGPAVILAIALAGLVATFNALSSAQLAARFPVSGGTFEYGWRTLGPAWGFSAGWMFLLAKTASAATAALGFAGYFLHLTGLDWPVVPLAVGIVVVLTAVVLAGLRHTTRLNMLIVGITVLALGSFILVGAWPAWRQGGRMLVPFFDPEEGGALPALLHATALMFVAYTGYGRIATLSEEVSDPEKNIPRAIVMTLVVSGAIYVLVALVAVGAVGAHALAEQTADRAAPLERVAATFGQPWVRVLVAVGAMTAMAGVLLNLILGLSRVWLAMARRGQTPAGLARVIGGTPVPAVVLTGLAIAGLALLGNVRTTWTFSAFTVLIYYGITNLAALRLARDQRRYHRAVPVAGLIGCLGLAFWVEWQVWASGVGLLILGLLWHAAAGRANRSPQPGE